MYDYNWKSDEETMSAPYSEDSIDVIPGDLHNNQSFLASLSDSNYDMDTICDDNVVSEHLFRPAAESSIRAFIQACAASPDKLVPRGWSLCTDENFNCASLSEYTSACGRMMAGMDTAETTTGPGEKDPCGVGDILAHGDAVLLLIFLVFLGALIGMAVTVGVCLICPGVHTWANSKVRRDRRRDKVFHEGVAVHARQSQRSNSSAYYTDIDDRHDRLNQLSVGNQLHSLASARTGSDRFILSGPSTIPNTNMGSPIYYDSGVPATPESEYTDPVGDMYTPANDYEILKRNDTLKQSVKYEQLSESPSAEAVGQCRHQQQACNSPGTDTGEAHDYFVIEKTL